MAQLKRKVTLRQKSVSNDELITQPPTPKKPWWPWVLGAIVVCGGLAIMLLRGNGTTGNVNGKPTQQVAKNVTHQNDSTTTKHIVSDTAASTEEPSSTKKDTSQTETPQKASGKNSIQQQNSNQQQAARTPKTNTSKSTTQNNTTVSSAVSSTAANGTVEEEAWRTIRGNYGNGAARKEALGNRYDEIQAKVNEFYRDGKVH